MSQEQGTATTTEDVEEERQRYWLVWVDDTPVFPESPLNEEQAAQRYLHEVAEDPDAVVEIKQCTREDLEWAGVEDGIGRDEEPIWEGALDAITDAEAES